MRYLLNDEGMSELREDILKYMSALTGASGAKTYSTAYDFIAYAKRNKKNGGAILEIMGLFLNDLLHGQGGGEYSADIQTAVKMLDVYVKYRKMINANGNYSACMECMILGLCEITQSSAETSPT